jgi:hypothetical protein
VLLSAESERPDGGVPGCRSGRPALVRAEARDTLASARAKQQSRRPQPARPGLVRGDSVEPWSATSASGRERAWVPRASAVPCRLALQPASRPCSRATVRTTPPVQERQEGRSAVWRDGYRVLRLIEGQFAPAWQLHRRYQPETLVADRTAELDSLVLEWTRPPLGLCRVSPLRQRPRTTLARTAKEAYGMAPVAPAPDELRSYRRRRCTRSLPPGKR